VAKGVPISQPGQLALEVTHIDIGRTGMHTWTGVAG
jgi:hypothetical protein